MGATNGSDYIGVEMAPLVFPIGSMNSDQQCLTISILDDDDALEGEESLVVLISATDEDVEVLTRATFLTISDNEGV